jgi:glycosyltransferase involved in cell wall biosynthesis
LKGNGFFVNAFWSRKWAALSGNRIWLAYSSRSLESNQRTGEITMKKWPLGKKDPQPADSPSPFRIGVWCDVEFTLSMRIGGIGVFVYNLVEGLLALDEPIDVTMLVRPGDQHMMDCLKGPARGRLRVVPELPSPPPTSFVWMDNIAWQWRGLQNQITVLRDSTRESFKKKLAPLVKRSIQQNIAWAALWLLALPFAFALAWTAYALFQLAAAVGLVLRFPFRVLYEAIRALTPSLSKSNSASKPWTCSREVAEAANCDVWIIPYLNVTEKLPKASVLFIHDLVISHYPEGINRNWIRQRSQRAQARAAEATICACMSSFIRDTDLIGLLGLPPKKVRMVRPAPPQDFPEVSEERARAIKPAQLVRPYLFMPAAIRGYKNQRILIEALRVLRDRHGENGIDVVLTGDTRDRLPPNLQKLVEKYGLQKHVHVLGQVDREVLAALYKFAFAVIMPTLYEQGSFPVYEGLHFGVPVACSDIPPLREQCAAMGDAMLYFNPHDAEAVAQTALRIRDQRSEICARQQTAGRLLWQRTWKDVAREWLVVFKEAAELGRQPIQPDAAILPLPAPWPYQVIGSPPSLITHQSSSCPELLLFLQEHWRGGVWENAKVLVRELVAINQQKRRLKLTLAAHSDQNLGLLETLGEDLRIERAQLDCLTRLEMINELGILPTWPGGAVYEYSFFRQGKEAALRADAWFGLVDRFPKPLAALRPYGLIIHDVLPIHLPEMFLADFLEMVHEGMKPTAQAAPLVIVTTPQTRDDVVAAYGLMPSRVRLIPVACEPHTRFQALASEPVDIPSGPFILNVANSNAHKGADVLLRAIAEVKQRDRAIDPKLVICGRDTEKFSPNHTGIWNHPTGLGTRQLVTKLGLEDEEHVLFMGYVTDAQLKYLYEHCSAVVNASKHDNGSYSLIEAAYFGRLVVSSQYPAAEFLCQRFEIPAKFFPIDDHSALADLIIQALTESPLAGKELDNRRAHRASPELSYRCYAERLYDSLVELAERGRQARIRLNSARPAA